MKTSDSVWHEKLSRLDVETEGNPYDKACCPDLVGNDQIGSERAHDLGAGFTTFILDVPPTEEELHHTRIALDIAARAGGMVDATPLHPRT